MLNVSSTRFFPDRAGKKGSPCGEQPLSLARDQNRRTHLARSKQKRFLNKKEAKVAKFQTPKEMPWTSHLEALVSDGWRQTRFLQKGALLPLLSLLPFCLKMFSLLLSFRLNVALRPRTCQTLFLTLRPTCWS